MHKKQKNQINKIAYLGKTLLLGVIVILNNYAFAQLKPENKGVSKPSTSKKAPATKKSGTLPQKKGNNSQSDKSKSSVKANSGNKKIGSDNNVNIDNSKKNININVDNSKDIKINNSRNTVVRSNNYRPYSRPPYRYGGMSFYCHGPYYYHPYRPFYWGPVWHPWGFFVAALATTAIIISIENQQYHYDQGVYYVAGNGGYTVVQAPVGATIITLPEKAETIVVTETVNNYYYGGAFYEKSDKGYIVVPPTAGTIIENLPEGGEEVTMGDQKYVKIGETYYQPIQKDGKNMYEVVDIKKDEN